MFPKTSNEGSSMADWSMFWSAYCQQIAPQITQSLGITCPDYHLQYTWTWSNPRRGVFQGSEPVYQNHWYQNHLCHCGPYKSQRCLGSHQQKWCLCSNGVYWQLINSSRCKHCGLIVTSPVSFTQLIHFHNVHFITICIVSSQYMSNHSVTNETHTQTKKFNLTEEGFWPSLMHLPNISNNYPPKGRVSKRWDKRLTWEILCWGGFLHAFTFLNGQFIVKINCV